jgi:hypothetical protein
MRRTARSAASSIVFGSLAVLLAGARCANPCVDLDERVCEDLGPADCERWRADPAISEGMLPGQDYASRRAGVATTTCRMWADEANYERATLPTIRWRIANARNPGTPDRRRASRVWRRPQTSSACLRTLTISFCRSRSRSCSRSDGSGGGGCRPRSGARRRAPRSGDRRRRDASSAGVGLSRVPKRVWPVHRESSMLRRRPCDDAAEPREK